MAISNTRTDKNEKTRKAIVKGGTRLFLRRGYANVSTRDVSKEVGITQPALYHYFADKEEIFLGVVQNLGSNFRKDLNKTLRNHKLDAEGQLMEIVTALKHPRPASIYELYNEAIAEMQKANAVKLDMLFKMYYLDPLGEFFSQNLVDMRSDLLPVEAAEVFLSSLRPIFGVHQNIGGLSITDEQRDRLILNCILYGLVKR
ncbi:MAG: TetR/AcrR family transcriptional regulator [Limosilactobacillus sp.]|uniref:TetR/AcrR family transcriptional regulator n=1 Tax=Limosilactobacillus sp. TaxID=2773925 RepID=UPI00270039A5|nr:TetR/AcrR family transcriptional regulator [Limosilactobacillus sp.]